MTITPRLSILVTDYIMTSYDYFNMYFITPLTPVQGRRDVFIPHTLMVPMMTSYDKLPSYINCTGWYLWMHMWLLFAYTAEESSRYGRCAFYVEWHSKQSES